MLLFWVLIGLLSLAIDVEYALNKLPSLSLISALGTACFAPCGLTPRAQVAIYGVSLIVLYVISKKKKPTAK